MAGQQRTNTASGDRLAASRALPSPAREGTVAELAALLAGQRVMVLTGAGCSTGSGIPDYRDVDGRWRGRQPMQFQEFLNSQAGRRRYWARSLAGWQRVAQAWPNDAHRALTELEARSRVTALVTQNVDALHQRAGSREVIDLHGRLDEVICLACGEVSSRAALQARLEAANPAWTVPVAAHAPDGDADLGDVDYAAFEIPGCRRCGGVLKPAVVFFGETVPKARISAAMAALAAADLLLVAGSSLMVWSGYRFVRAARAAGTPVVAVGLGVTRGESELAFRITGNCAEVLPALLAELD